MADWSHLPKELLLLIAKGLQTHFDLLHFRAVCPNWRASAPVNLRPPPFHSPVFLGTYEDDGERSFLLKHTVCLLVFPSNHSQTMPRSWLVMLEEDEFGKRHILHPFWRCDRKLVRHSKILLDISKLHVQELGHELGGRGLRWDWRMSSHFKECKRVGMGLEKFARERRREVLSLHILCCGSYSTETWEDN